MEELWCGIEELKSNTAPVERVHGENLRRALCRICTTSESGKDLNAWHVNRELLKDEDYDPTCTDEKQMVDALERKRKDARAERVERARLVRGKDIDGFNVDVRVA